MSSDGRAIGGTFFPFQRWNLKSDAKPKHLLNIDQPVPTRGLKSFRQPFQERPNDNHKGKTLVHRNNVEQGLQTKTFYQCGPRALKKEVGHTPPKRKRNSPGDENSKNGSVESVGERCAAMSVDIQDENNELQLIDNSGLGEVMEDQTIVETEHEIVEQSQQT
ncbi:hypothetical protein OUZ56_003857 [Daphnia magna]|uniref:Uncharacterized protein n=1 Tax=Daphnia magna TaxID=35525 RepID=A0ABQ9YN09_9CRUS|nr:hypothetical protein OUZ56_003857 [Daphnia magna]